MEDLVLSIDQCRHLQELGLDMSDARFYWRRKTYEQVRCEDFVRGTGFRRGKRRCPERGDYYVEMSGEYLTTPNIITWTYTLEEVLNKLPKEIIINDAYYYPTMCYDLIDNKWQMHISYCRYCDWGFEHPLLQGGKIHSPYDLLCWVLENGYLK